MRACRRASLLQVLFAACRWAYKASACIANECKYPYREYALVRLRFDAPFVFWAPVVPHHNAVDMFKSTLEPSVCCLAQLGILE